jgi:hypothetical protein
VAVEETSSGIVYDILNPEAVLGQRERIVKEIYTSEKDYVHKLTQLVEECYYPVTKGKYKNTFSDADRKFIFSEIEIVHRLAVKFLADLQARLNTWHDANTIGDVFLQMVKPMTIIKIMIMNMIMTFLSFLFANRCLIWLVIW